MVFSFVIFLLLMDGLRMISTVRHRLTPPHTPPPHTPLPFPNDEREGGGIAGATGTSDVYPERFMCRPVFSTTVHGLKRF